MDEFTRLVKLLPEDRLVALIARLACELDQLGLLTDIERRRVTRRIEMYISSQKRAAA